MCIVTNVYYFSITGRNENVFIIYLLYVINVLGYVVIIYNGNCVVAWNSDVWCMRVKIFVKRSFRFGIHKSQFQAHS